MRTVRLRRRFAMLSRNGGGDGAEGFGTVSGGGGGRVTPCRGQRGAAEAVVDERPSVVQDPADPAAVAAALRTLLAHEDERRAMGVAGRARAVEEFSYDVLAARLGATLTGWEAALRG